MQAIGLLLTEGDMMIADILADALADAGYDVIKRPDGLEAAELLQDDRQNIRGLIADVDLGPARGWALARMARERRPQMAIVYTTGRKGEDWPVEGVPNSVLILKPYATGQIVAAIAQLLNQNGAAPHRPRHPGSS